MGVDTNIHIGPYMIVEGEKTEMVDREVNTCSNNDCETYKTNQLYTENQKFCAECGSPTAIKNYKKKWTIDPRGLIIDDPYCDEFCDELTWTDPMGCGKGMFISNEFSPFDKERDDIEGYEVVDLINANPHQEIEWFKKRYEKIIGIFKKEFGENSIKISWGLIEWYS